VCLKKNARHATTRVTTLEALGTLANVKHVLAKVRTIRRLMLGLVYITITHFRYWRQARHEM
jgi:hypothetical protein